jgi:glyoxylase-like metal-dependent hydrolase (beta-lactamase superfamily II)
MKPLKDNSKGNDKAYAYYWEEKNILFDCGSGENSIPYDPNHVLLTHTHADHAGGSYKYGDRVYVHEEELQDLRKGVQDPEVLENFMRDGYEMRPAPQARSLAEFSDPDIKILFTPGHTKGSVCYLVKDQWLITGDTLYKADKGMLIYDDGRWLRSLDLLEQMLKANPKLLVLGGHYHTPMISSIALKTIEKWRKWLTEGNRTTQMGHQMEIDERDALTDEPLHDDEELVFRSSRRLAYNLDTLIPYVIEQTGISGMDYFHTFIRRNVELHEFSQRDLLMILRKFIINIANNYFDDKPYAVTLFDQWLKRQEGNLSLFNDDPNLEEILRAAFRDHVLRPNVRYFVKEPFSTPLCMLEYYLYCISSLPNYRAGDFNLLSNQERYQLFWLLLYSKNVNYIIPFCLKDPVFMETCLLQYFPKNEPRPNQQVFANMVDTMKFTSIDAFFNLVVVINQYGYVNLANRLVRKHSNIIVPKNLVRDEISDAMVLNNAPRLNVLVRLFNQTFENWGAAVIDAYYKTGYATAFAKDIIHDIILAYPKVFPLEQNGEYFMKWVKQNKKDILPILEV